MLGSSTQIGITNMSLRLLQWRYSTYIHTHIRPPLVFVCAFCNCGYQSPFFTFIFFYVYYHCTIWRFIVILCLESERHEIEVNFICNGASYLMRVGFSQPQYSIHKIKQFIYLHEFTRCEFNKKVDNFFYILSLCVGWTGVLCVRSVCICIAWTNDKKKYMARKILPTIENN